MLRTYNLNKVPYGFFCDEAATGYNAYSILKTGNDEFGDSFPVFFYSFGNNRLPLPIYMTVPFVAIFGLNEFSTRLATAFYASLTIPLIFIFLGALFPKKTVTPYFGAMFLAIAPWHVHFSRTAHEYIYLPLFILLGLIFFIHSVRRKKAKYLHLSFINFGVAFYTYYPSYLIVPLTMGLCIMTYFKQFISFGKNALYAFIVFFVVSIPLIAGFINGRALTRWNEGQVSIFSKYKNPSDILFKVTHSYVLHFSPTFLFTKGDIDFPGQFITRHSVRGMGMLYLFELPLILSALSSLVFKGGKSRFFIFGILLIHPFSNAVTSTLNPYAPRSILGSVSWPMISAVGVSFLLETEKYYKKIVMSFLFIGVSLCLYEYLFRYYKEYALYSSDYWGWQYGPREITGYFLNHSKDYDEMFMQGKFNGVDIFFKFYDPENKCANKCFVGGVSEYSSAKKQLFAIDKEELKNIPTELLFTVNKILYYPDNTPAFFIGTISKNNAV